MTKNHHQSKAEQIYNKTHGAQGFHFDKRSNQANEPVAIDDHLTQIQSYQIHPEKGKLRHIIL